MPSPGFNPQAYKIGEGPKLKVSLALCQSKSYDIYIYIFFFRLNEQFVLSTTPSFHSIKILGLNLEFIKSIVVALNDTGNSLAFKKKICNSF